MRDIFIIFVLLIVAAAVLAPALAGGGIDALKESCEQGSVNADLCSVIETTGLFDPTPAPAAAK